MVCEIEFKVQMTQIQLPFLTSSVTTASRSGKLLFGWSSTLVDVREANAGDFRLAACHVYTETHSQSVYAHDNLFWTSAMYCARPVPFNNAGLAAEALFTTDGKHDHNWHQLLSNCLVWTMRARAQAQGVIFPVDSKGNVQVRASLSPGDGHEDDRIAFLEWCEDNLRFADGRLLVRVHAPSIVLSWASDGMHRMERCLPFRKAQITATFGRYRLEPGLHFSPHDPACDTAWWRLTDAFGMGMSMSDGYTSGKSMATALAMLRTLGLSDRMLVRDMMLYDPEVLSDIEKHHREDMAERSAFVIAHSILATTPIHFYRSRRAELEELKVHLNTAPADRPSDLIDRVETFLMSLKMDDQPARAWFVNEVLDRLADRQVRLAPTVNPKVSR
jgi:hypothetical protein